MDKDEFLEELEYKLRGLPEEDYRRAMSFYRERLTDKHFPKGEDVTRLVGTPDEAAREVLNKTYEKPVKVPKEKRKSGCGGVFMAIILVIILLISGTAFILRHFHPNINIPFIYSSSSVYDTVTVDEFSSIDIDTNTAAVKIISTGNEYRVEYDVQDRAPEISVHSGTLKLTHKSESSFHIFNFSDDNEITVYVPSGTQLDTVTAKNDTGSVKLIDTNAKNVTLIADTGSVTIDNVKSDIINADSDTGSITLKQSTAKTVELKADTGSVKAENCEIDSLKCQSDTGSVKVEDTIFSTLDAKAETGSIKILGIPGSEEDYTIDLKADTGSVKINGDKQSDSYHSTGKTDKKITASASTGSVTLEFDK